MKKIIVLLVSILSISTLAQVKKTDLKLGETLEFKSTILNETRKLNVYLPASYTDSINKSYPVIYLLDGGIDEDFIHTVGLVQFATFPWVNTLPESIVVGIKNTDRKRDFTYPTSIKQDQINFPTSGKSEDFISFLEKEVQSTVQKEYRTSSKNTIIGQSLGGLLATEVLLKKPSLFDTYIIISPSLWWDNNSLMKLKLKHMLAKTIHISVGDEGPTMISSAANLASHLYPMLKPEDKIHFNYLPDSDHGNISHEAIYKAFIDIYKK